MQYPYEVIASQELFQEFIMDLIERMGVSKEDLTKLFSPVNKEKNMKEFAKCFVTKYADPIYNYEVYELAGDSSINNAIVMYFLNQIKSAQEEYKKTHPDFIPGKNTIDYYNKLKSLYISVKELNDFATRLGFDEFLIIGDIAPVKQKNPDFDPDKLVTDSFEAFIGCFEFMVDRYLKHLYSHYYVSNFVHYLYTSRKIDYRPEVLYDYITLLKETNDTLRKTKRPPFQYIVKQNPEKTGTFLYFVEGDMNGTVFRASRSRIVPKVQSMQGILKVTENPMSRAALRYITEICRNPAARDPLSPDATAVIQESDIRVPPDASTFGITSLIDSNYNDE